LGPTTAAPTLTGILTTATAASVASHANAFKDKEKAQAILQATLDAKLAGIDKISVGLEKAKLDMELKEGRIRKIRLMLKALLEKHSLLNDELSKLIDPADIQAALSD